MNWQPLGATLSPGAKQIGPSRVCLTLNLVRPRLPHWRSRHRLTRLRWVAWRGCRLGQTPLPCDLQLPLGIDGCSSPELLLDLGSKFPPHNACRGLVLLWGTALGPAFLLWGRMAASLRPLAAAPARCPCLPAALPLVWVPGWLRARSCLPLIGWRLVLVNLPPLHGGAAAWLGGLCLPAVPLPLWSAWGRAVGPGTGLLVRLLQVPVDPALQHLPDLILR